MDDRYDQDRDETGSLVHDYAYHEHPFHLGFDSAALTTYAHTSCLQPKGFKVDPWQPDDVRNGKVRAKPTVSNI